MNSLNEINKVNNLPAEIAISIIFMIVFVLFTMLLETLIYVKGDEKSKFVTFVYILGGPLFWYVLYRSKQNNGLKRDTIGLMIMGPLLWYPILQMILVWSVFFLVDRLRYLDYLNSLIEVSTTLIVQLLTYRILGFLTIMIFGYVLINGVKAHQVYQKRIREESETYNLFGKKILKMERIEKKYPDLLLIFDNYKQFIKEPVNILNYVIYPILIYICMLFAGPTNIYRGYLYSLAIFISIAVIVIQPLFFKESSRYGKYHFVVGLKKLSKYLVAAIALALIYALLSDGLDEVESVVSGESVLWSMLLLNPYSKKYYLYIFAFIIGNVLVFLILRPKVYLTEYRYVNDKGSKTKKEQGKTKIH